MILYVVRHGIAEDHNKGGDAARELTRTGKEKVKEVMRFLRGEISPDLFLTSPLVRAVQTAEIAAEVLGYKRDVELSDALLPESSSGDTFGELDFRRENGVIIFGHNPHLSYLVSDGISSGAAEILLKKASVTAIEFGPSPRQGDGLLKWMITPGVLGL